MAPTRCQQGWAPSFATVENDGERKQEVEQSYEVWSASSKRWEAVLTATRVVSDNEAPHLFVLFHGPGGQLRSKKIFFFEASPNLRVVGERTNGGARPPATSVVATCWGQVEEEEEEEQPATTKATEKATEAVQPNEESSPPKQAQVEPQPVVPGGNCQQQEATLEEEEEELPQAWIAGRFQLHNKIGSGSFSCVYSATDTQAAIDVAVKLESTASQHPQLREEAKRYKALMGGEQLPTVYWSGQEGTYNVLVMDLLGSSLEAHFRRCDLCFSLPTTLRLGGQMLEGIRYVHSKGFIHRDIKPDNFAMGRGSASKRVYVVDFGLAKRFRHEQSGKHIPWRKDVGFVGTARYASAASHLGHEQARRDDVQALGYVLVYFTRGELPWQGTARAMDKRERHRQIAAMKKSISVQELCKDLPSEFIEYFKHCEELNFCDAPDYTCLQRLLQAPLQRGSKAVTFAGQFDWEAIDEHTSDASL